MKRNPLKIVAACGLGTGTALFLKMTLDDILKEAGIDADVETADATLAKTADADIIVTAQDLADIVRQNVKVKEVVEITNYGKINEIRDKLMQAISRIG